MQSSIGAPKRQTNSTGPSAVFSKYERAAVNTQPLADALPLAITSSPADRVGALFDAHHDRLYRLARRLTPSADDARDLVQETFLKAARSSTSVPYGLAREEAWLVRVLVNIRRDEWRKSAVRRRFDSELRGISNVNAGEEAVLIARAIVWHALDSLAPRRRAVIVMHEIEGLTTSAIAALLGISAITVRWHLSMGRHELTRVLKPETGDVNEHDPKSAARR
jgi:RNA polymerase sigma factor (sigma-70 family)